MNKASDKMSSLKRKSSSKLKNEDALLLLVHTEKFQNSIKSFRIKFGLPPEGFFDDPYLEILKDGVLNEPSKSGVLSVGLASEMLGAIDKILEEYKLPPHFKKSIYKIVTHNEVFPPLGNFSIRVSPLAQIDSSTGNVVQYAQEISIVTFKPLDVEEQRVAIKTLKGYWNRFFPPHITKRTNLREPDIRKKYRLVKEMENRKMKDVFEESSYLKKVKKDYGEAKYRSTKKLNPKETTIKEKKRTSKDVAKDLRGTKKKAGAVRVAYSRLKEKMEK